MVSTFLEQSGGVQRRDPVPTSVKFRWLFASIAACGALTTIIALPSALSWFLAPDWLHLGLSLSGLIALGVTLLFHELAVNAAEELLSREV